MAAFYAVYHGPQGLKDIALRVHNMAQVTARVLSQHGMYVVLYVDVLARTWDYTVVTFSYHCYYHCYCRYM